MNKKYLIGIAVAIVALIIFNRQKAKAAGNTKVPVMPAPKPPATKPKTVTGPTAPKAPTVKSPVFQNSGGFGEFVKDQTTKPGPYKPAWMP